jgi:thiamine biosynthesis lipoprotein
MGSAFHIKGYAKSPQEALLMESAFKIGESEIERIENLLTDFRDSPFQTINSSAGLKPVKVSSEIFSLLKKSLHLSELSGGAFDISYASLGQLWRRAKKSGLLPAKEEILEARRHVDYRKIKLDSEQQTVFLPHKSMRIGFGGVGKGYAVDQAFQKIKSLFPEGSFMVNGAGDIRAQCAPNAPRPWIVGIRNPFGSINQSCGMLTLKQGAIATSGIYEQFMPSKEGSYHHIVDCRSGTHPQDVASVTIVAVNALTADLLATTALAMGMVDGADFIQRQPDVEGVLISTTGRVKTTKQWHQEDASRFSIKNLGPYSGINYKTHQEGLFA